MGTETTPDDRRHRITVDLSAREVAVLDVARSLTDASTSGVVREALFLFHLVATESANGARLVIEREGCQSEIVIPALRSLKRSERMEKR